MKSACSSQPEKTLDDGSPQLEYDDAEWEEEWYANKMFSSLWEEGIDFTMDMDEIRRKQRLENNFVSFSKTLELATFGDKEKEVGNHSVLVGALRRLLKKFKEAILEPIVYRLTTCRVVVVFYTTLFLCHMLKTIRKKRKEFREVVVVDLSAGNETDD